ncbi:MAG TPA: hypothetical protein PLB78_14400, partial [Anaerolineae bacterium]|nr:hypothetical protein [Anaerolineae bacterium]
MSESDTISRLQAALPDARVQPVEGAKDPTFLVEGDLLQAAAWLRAEGGYDFLSSVTGVDRGDH